MNNSWNSIATRLNDLAGIVCETQPLLIVLVLLLKLTILLGLAWVFHTWVGENRPVWRRLMWRTTSVGMLLLLVLATLPPLVSLDILPGANDNVDAVNMIANLPTGTNSANSSETTNQSSNTIRTLPTEDNRQPVTPEPQTSNANNQQSIQPGSIKSKRTGLARTRIQSKHNFVSARPQMAHALTTRPTPDNVPARSVEPGTGWLSGWFSLARILTIAWIAGCAFVLARIAIGWYLLRCIRRESVPVPTKLIQLTQDIADGMQLRTVPQVAGSPRVETPCLAGLANPVILLPTSIIDRPGDADMASMIAHECAHLERNDLQWNAVWHGFTVLLWFHPLVWRSRLAHVDSCDGVVDARVSGHFNNLEQYCQTLALLALRAKATIPATSLGMARKSTVRKRIEKLNNGFAAIQLSQRKARVFVGLATLLALLLGTIGVSRTFAAATTESNSTSAGVSVSAKDEPVLNASAAKTSQELLPSKTKAWFSIPNATRLDEKFLKTQLGKLTQSKELAPFVDSLKGQLQNWLNDKNARFGLKVKDIQGVRSGEICIAGVLPNQQPAGRVAPDSHGLVLLVDVSGNLDEAKGLMTKLSKELIERGATKEKFNVSVDAQVSKWKFPNKIRIKKPRYAYHTITGGWLLSSDNEAIFRKILRKLVNIDSVKKDQTLATHPAFQNVMNKIKLQGIKPDVSWYVNTFGYIQLAQAVASERQKFKQKNNDDWARILQLIGFDGFKGVGGYIAFATEDHELLHRTFVFKPVEAAMNIKQKRVFGMLDFKNPRQTLLTPPAFISDKASGYFGASWNMQAALKNVGHAIDTFVRKEGVFNDTLNDLRQEMQVDITKVVDNFDNEIMVISDSEMPIQSDSERIVIAIRLKGNPDYVINNIKKSWPHQHELFQYQGNTIVKIDESIGEEELDGGFRDPFEDADEQFEEQSFSLFENRFCAAAGDYLFVANNLDYLKVILHAQSTTAIADANDYQRIAKSLEKITDGTRISFRQFSRLDRVVRPNYELMRTGKMAASGTILARLINHLSEANKDDPAKRNRKIDASKLPPDFELHVAPYLGPSGWVMESTDDGWLFTGVVLDRKQTNK